MLVVMLVVMLDRYISHGYIEANFGDALEFIYATVLT